jgi:hypothetical protein
VTRRCELVHLRLPNSPQRMVPPYSSTEVAMAIGVSLDTFYRTRQIRHERDGLPAPISERGPLKWERTGFDAWLTRHHPMRRRRSLMTHSRHRQQQAMKNIASG